MLPLECIFQLLVHKLLDLLLLIVVLRIIVIVILDLLWIMLLNIRNLVGLSQKDLWEGIRGAEVVNLV